MDHNSHSNEVATPDGRVLLDVLMTGAGPQDVYAPVGATPAEIEHYRALIPIAAPLVQDREVASLLRMAAKERWPWERVEEALRSTEWWAECWLVRKLYEEDPSLQPVDLEWARSRGWHLIAGTEEQADG